MGAYPTALIALIIVWFVLLALCVGLVVIVEAAERRLPSNVTRFRPAGRVAGHMSMASRRARR